VDYVFKKCTWLRATRTHLAESHMHALDWIEH
jgi:hypothetical protein